MGESLELSIKPLQQLTNPRQENNRNTEATDGVGVGAGVNVSGGCWCWCWYLVSGPKCFVCKNSGMDISTTHLKMLRAQIDR